MYAGEAYILTVEGIKVEVIVVESPGVVLRPAVNDQAVTPEIR